MNLIIDVKSRNPYNDCILRNIIFFQYLPTSIGLVDQMGTRFDRLRYAPQSVRQQRSKATMRFALLLPEQSEGKTKVMRK